jgi:hypothetical protein
VKTVTLLALTFVGACSSPERSATPPDALTKTPSVPPVALQPLSFEVASDLPPVPGNIATAARPPAVVKAAYLFAARHPEVLKYMPCFCGCERAGHKGNDDCFVEKRDATGKPSEWVTHGMVCEVCIDVATEAMQMHSSGASLAKIREGIETRHANGQFRTPTPMPPHDAAHN